MSAIPLRMLACVFIRAFTDSIHTIHKIYVSTKGSTQTNSFANLCGYQMNMPFPQDVYYSDRWVPPVTL